MVKRTEQLINRFYQMLLRNDGCHFERGEKSVSFNSLRFPSRGLIRNDRTENSKRSLIAHKHYLIVFLFLFTLLFLAGCANQLPPGGGEDDITPPQIIYSYPENGTTNFQDDFIELEFSEYVDKRSFKEALFISPSVDDEVEISWSGKTVEIFFPSGLKSDLTYVITVGTDVVDFNNKNRMTQSFSFSFATGDKIDKRSISGNVYGKEIEGTLIYAYRYTGDTTKYLSNKPDYVSQIGKDGSYKLFGLSESDYRVFAVKDQFRDFLYNADQDLIGIPEKNISLIGPDSSFNGLNFFLMKVDTIKPRLIGSIMTDKHHLVVTLSEECDSTTYLSDNFVLIDSTENKSISLQYLYRNKSKKEEFILAHSIDLKLDNNYYLHAKSLRDLYGNTFENELSSLTISEKPDTTFPKISQTEPRQNQSIDFKDPSLRISFDDAVLPSDIRTAFELSDTLKNKINFKLIKPDDATFLIKPDQELKPETNYLLKINLAQFSDAAGNKIDSVYTLKFQTISGIEFTGLSGKVTTNRDNIVLVLQSYKDIQKFYTTKPDKTLAYSFVRIEAGTYSLWMYSDTDSSGTFNTGYPDPFKYSESFFFVKDSINLRPRWSVTDYNLEFK